MSATLDVRPPEALLIGGPRLRDELVPLAPAAVTIVLWFVWIGSSGGYYATMWYPSALGALSLFVIAAAWQRRVLPTAPAARVALLAFAALVVWNYVSILWADAPGSALGAANEMLLYLLMGVTFAVLPWSRRTLGILLGVWAAGVAAFCAVELIRAASATRLDPFFNQYRYAVPMNYPNATGALAMTGLLPALLLSATREVPRWLRVGFLPIAVFLAEVALLPQSRAVLLGLIVGIPLVLILARERWRIVSRLVVIGAALVVSVPKTIDVDNALSANRHVAPVLHQAAITILWTSLAAVVVSAGLVLAESRWGRPLRPARRWVVSRRAGILLACGALIVIAAGAAVAAPHVAHFVSQNATHDTGTSGTRLLSTSPEERIDYARVALKLFAGSPLLGVGAGNFGLHYDALRRFQKHSLYTHDLALRVLSENGIPGILLFCVLVAALGWGIVRTGLRLGGLGRACCVAVAAIDAYFLVHASVDWMDEFPVLAAPALALPMAAMALPAGLAHRAGAARARLRLLPGRSGWLRTPAARAAAWAGGGLAVLAALIALGGPYLSALYTQRALSIYPFHPRAAATDLSRAAALDPLSANPLIARGTIDEQLHEPGAARAAFAESLQRERGWFALLQMALLDAQAGRFSLADQELAQVSKLDVDDPLVGQARALFKRRVRVNPLQFNALLTTSGAQSDVFKPEHIR